MSDLGARLRESTGRIWLDALLVEAAERIEDLEAVQAELLHEINALKADIDQCPFHGPIARWDLP